MSSVMTPEACSALHPEVDPFRREQWAFYCMLGDLLKTHRGQYVAVRERRVVASGTERTAVILKAREQVGNVPIYVGQVTDEPPGIERVPRYRHPG